MSKSFCLSFIFFYLGSKQPAPYSDARVAFLCLVNQSAEKSERGFLCSVAGVDQHCIITGVAVGSNNRNKPV